MSIERLKVQNVRNLASVELSLSPGINVFYGENGSGKTSLLEAVHFLGVGRSFRTHHPKRALKEEEDFLSVYADLVEKTGRPSCLAMMRDQKSQSKMKIDGEPVSSISAIASHLPILLLNAESFRLLQAPPQIRRQFLDWVVFHVEPRYFPVWQRYGRNLKQRNALLRQNAPLKDLAAWDAALVEAAELIDQLRSAVFSQWQEVAQSVLAELLPNIPISLEYKRGWPLDTPYQEALRGAYLSDIAVQYTRYGPHRADIKIKRDGLPAQERLSMGQQKMLITSLTIAQGVLLKQAQGSMGLFLIDDLPAELDQRNLQRVGDALMAMDTQMMVTSVQAQELSTLFSKPGSKMFHVEQGNVLEVE